MTAVLLAGVLSSQCALGGTIVGTFPGQFSVGSTGAATYRLPLDLPPGVNGLKPKLALLYNSQASNGFLGEGWSLTGLSVISRCPQTLDQDNAIHVPDGTTADRFCLDGQRLILTSGTYGAADSVYHTEAESFQQVTANGSAGGSPTSFTVVDRSGLTRVYSTVPFSCTTATACPSGAALEWLITRVTDRYGNFVSFQYDVGLFNGGDFANTVAVSEVDYGSSAGTVGKVLFTYDNTSPGKLRSDTYSQFVSATGFAINVNAVMLTGITVQDGSGNALRSYTLDYTVPNTAEIPVTLTSVQECAGDGTCFNPTSFTYSGAPNSFSGGNYLGNGSAVQGSGFQVLDLDGDGLPDYLYTSNNTVYVIFGSTIGTASSTPISTTIPGSTNNQAGIGLQGAVVTDLNGDGQQELLVPYYAHPGEDPNTPTWYLLKWNGQTGSNANLIEEPAPTTSGSTVYACASDDGCTPDAVAVDMNGNGGPGILFADDNTHQLYYYANINATLSNTVTPTSISYTDVNGKPPRLTLVNYDGQGTPEVYVAGTGVVKWNRGTGKFELISGNFNDANDTVVFVNDGGLTSAVVLGAGNDWYYCANTGEGFSFLQQGSTQIPNACGNNYFVQPFNLDLSQAQPIDFFGNGQQEVIVPDTQSGTWYLFDQSGGSAPLNVSDVPYAGSDTEFVDINGDGRSDMLFTSDGHTKYDFNNAHPYLLNQITNGLGHNTDVGYIPIDQATHSDYVNQPSPVISAPHIRAYMGPMYVVDDYAVDSGLSNSNGPEQIYTYYIYAGAAVDQWGRGFLGFSEVEAVNYNTGLYTKVTYGQTFPYAGMVTSSSKFYDVSLVPTSNPAPYVGPTRVKVICTYANPAEPDCELQGVSDTSSPPPATFTTGGTPTTTTTNTGFSNVAPYTGVYYPYVGTSTVRLYDLTTGSNYETTTTTSTYQAVGSSTPIGVDIMPTDINVSTTAGTGSTTTTAAVETQTGYGDESSCPGHATSVNVTDSYNDTAALAKSESFEYDGNCFLTLDIKTIVGLPNAGSMTLTKQYTSDGFGNPLSITVSGTGISPARITSMSYDPSARFPVSITNALGQTESLTYNGWGEELSDTDPNGDTVTYSYYGLGRKHTQSGPEPAVHTNWNYSACSGCVANAVYEVIQGGSDGSQLATQYDEFGRVLRSEHIGFGGEPVYQDTQYDLLGRVSQTSIPFKSGQTECWDTKNYDVLNRVVSETQPYNATASSCGSIRTITLSYNGLVTNKTVGATGTTVTSETTATTLNALGKPATVADAGGATTYNYDPWGNVISVTPPDGATVSMSYDSAGDKWNMHDPNMGAWSYAYDALGELLTQTNAKNQTVSNTYDALGRLVQRTEPEGTSIWKYDIAYGAGIGRLAYKEGPNGVWEGYAYNAYGHPTDKITVVNDQEYWVTTTYDNQGRISQLVYPNLTGINVNSTPATPAGLQVAVDANNNAQFDVTWTAQQNGEIYHLYRTASGATAPTDADEIYSGPDANWPDNTISSNGTYEWWLKACNDTNCSGYTTTSLTVTLPPTVPGAPNVPSNDTHAQSIALSWLGSSLVSTTAGPVTYEILQSYTPVNGSAGAFTQIATAPTASTTVALSHDGTYVFAIRACTSNACSAAGGASAAYQTYLQPSIPASTSTPSTVEPTSSPATYTVSWPAPNFAGGAVTYVLQEETGTGGFTSVYTGASLSYAESKTQDGKYSYRVEACDANSVSVCSDFTSTTTVAVTLPPTSPGTPSPPSSDQHSSSWDVTWTPSTINSGSSGSVSYQLEQSFNGGGYLTVSGVPVLVSGTMDAAAKAILSDGYYQGGTYTYRLRACTSDASTGGSACTNYLTSGGYSTTIAPGEPSSLSVPSSSNGDGSFTVTYGAPAANSGGEPTSYEVQLGDVSCESAQNCTTYWVDGNCTSATLSCPFTADQVAPGTYVTRVEAFDNTVSGTYLTTGGITVSYVIPTAPTGVEITPGTSNTGHYILSWNPSSGTTSYKIYSSGGTYVNTVSGTPSKPPATSAGFSEPDGAYSYYVEACNRGGCSGASATASVTVSIPPGAMGAISVTHNPSYNGNYTLSWSAPSGAVTDYVVYMSKNGAAYDSIGSTSSLTYPILDMTTGSYAYYVVACYQSECDSASPVLTVNVIPPAVPTGVEISPNPSTNGSFTMSWGAVSGVTDYVVFTGSGVYVQSTSNSSWPFSDVTNGTYSYYVIACDNTACSNPSATATETVLGLPGKPSSISLNPTSTTSNLHFVLSWGSASGTVSSYRVNGATSYSSSTHTASYQEPAGTYSYYVQACNSAGCGPATATVYETVKSVTCFGITSQTKPGQVQPNCIRAVQGPGTDGVRDNTSPTASSLSVPAVFRSTSRRMETNTQAVGPAVSAGHVSQSTRQAFFLARAGRRNQSSKPLIPVERDGRFGSSNQEASRSMGRVAGDSPSENPGHLRSTTVLNAQGAPAVAFEMWRGSSRGDSLSQHTGWHYAPAINPRLSEYPPLRRDPRVLAHFASLGGVLPGHPLLTVSSQPTGGTALMVGYVYNTVGYLTEVQKLNSSGINVRVLWQATDETALGQVDQESFDAATDGSNSAVSVNNTYDAATGVLIVGNTEAAMASTQVDYSYTWDGYNNVLTRNLEELVPSGQTAPPTLHDIFTYDALNRLKTVNTYAGSYSNSESMNYNVIGGFLNKGGYANFSYSNPGYMVNGYTYSQPDAVSSLTTPTGATRSFTYDANGNLLTESGDVNRSVIWMSYNKPSQITGDGATETFVYGPDRSRLQTAITKDSDTVTTTYIDGLFERVYDSATGDLIYQHYILAGGARVGVETIAANSGGTITSDTLSFYVRDEVGSVIATITEGLGGVNQAVALTSYGAWGKARATTGTGAYQMPAPGTFYSPTPSSQEEGFAGHDNLEDTGLVDMEGRVYDPEVGSFLSPDPNVQYPFSSQGYDRYSYVYDNPLSLSDPSGYFSLNEGGIGQIISDAGPFLNAIPVCEYWCTAAAEAVGGYMQSGNNVGAGLRAGVLSFGESYAFTYVGDESGWGTSPGALFGKAVTEGVIGGAFSEAGGGNFGDGFIGAFTSSELSPVIGQIGGGANSAEYYSASNMAARAVVSAIVGGTIAEMTGGNFGNAAFAAAMQRMFNDEITAKELQEEHESCGPQCVLIVAHGKPMGYVPPDMAAKVLLSSNTDGTLSDWTCDTACLKKFGYAALTGITIATGGITLGGEVAAGLAADEETATALESTSRVFRLASIASGTGAFLLHPNIASGVMVGVGASVLFMPLPEVQIFMEVFLEGEEVNHATKPATP